MTVLERVGLRARLAVALAAVAVLAVALATMLADAGLNSRLNQYATQRLDEAAAHSAELAAGLYAADGRWSAATVNELGHLAAMDGYRLTLLDTSGRALSPSPLIPGRPRADAPVLVSGRAVGTVGVAPLAGRILTSEDRALRDRLVQLHLIAGGLAVALGLLAAVALGPALARPLRRVTDAARRIQRGDLHARVEVRGAPEIRQLGRAFNRLAETLEREEQIRREAAEDIAHELRTPLSGIVSRIEAAQDGVLRDEQQNLEAMHTESLRLTRLVEDLGRLAEAQRPGLTLPKEPVDLRDLVSEQAGVHRDYFAAKQIRLEEKLAPAWVFADRGCLTQIVDNLLSNALRYTDPGGTVTITLTPKDGDVSIEVADTGVGISGEDLPYIFERFWRGERSRARLTGGAGIGLAIVRELVRAHDGQIDVESKPGQGSVFRVALPAAHASS